MESQEKSKENMPTPLLLVEDLTIYLGGQRILHHVDLEVYPGEIVTIIGPNGAGKSTLLKAVLGLVTVQSGHIKRHPDLCIGYVPQRLSVDSTLPISVADFIRLSQTEKKSSLPFEKFLPHLGCDTLLNRPLGGLSGGEMQRVLLARALVRSPNLLVLDEPTQGMDITGEKGLYEFLEFLRQEYGMGLLLVSHDLRFVMAATDHVICLNHHICCSGTPLAVSTDPEFLALFPAQDGLKPDGLNVALFGTDLDGFGLYQHNHDHQHTPQGVLSSFCGHLAKTPKKAKSKKIKKDPARGE